MDDQSLGKPGLAQAILQSIEKERLAREQREAKERRDAIREFVVHFQSVAFDKAAAYVALIVSAGYVGFFAIWGWVQPHLARWEVLTTALLLGFSLFVFIFWQVFGMTLFGIQQMKIARLIETADADLEAVMAEDTRAATRIRNRVAKTWPLVFAVSMVPGLAGGVLLLIACARHLFEGPPVAS